MSFDSQQHVIAVRGLTKKYGNLTAVSNVSFHVPKGGVFAFLGPNGAGKTTTVEIIETIRKPTAGTVHVLGMNVATHKRDVVRRIGVLPQNFASFDRLTVRESIQYYASLFKANAGIDRLLSLTHLHEKQHAQFHTLSGGLRQRLGIAIALVNDPEIVFLDEPSAGLDPSARRTVWDALLGLKDHGKTVFLTTHYMEEAQLLADEIAIITNGRIAATGSPQQLIDEHTSRMLVSLESVHHTVHQLLQDMKLDPLPDDQGNISLRIKNTQQLSDILAAIKHAQLPMPDVEVRKPNLEEVFLSITRTRPQPDLVKQDPS